MAQRHVIQAFLWGLPIGALGGLIGLGGAEFRLPVLVGALGYAARQAIPLNLAISLVTLTVALGTRARVLSLTAVAPLVPVIAGLIVGAVSTAVLGASLAARLPRKRLEGVIAALLGGIGLLLIVEGMLPHGLPPLMSNGVEWRAVSAALFGLGIGLVSSMLGVAGGELIIPTLVFIYGADIKAAGTASLFVSLPTVVVGITRYASLGAFGDRQALIATVLPMGIGSLFGVIAGGAAAGIVNPALLKIGLGAILITSAFRIFGHIGH